MIKRTLSTLSLWLLLLGIPYFFGPAGAVWILAIASFLTQMELYALLERMGFTPKRWLGYGFGTFLILGTWYLPGLYGTDVLTVCIIASSIAVLIKPEFDETRLCTMPTLLGFLLVPFMLNVLGFLIHKYDQLGQPETGILLTLWLVAVSKFTDIGGLLIGSSFGRHKLAPEISPGKTWEGAFGGIIIASILGALMCIFFHQIAPMPKSFTPLLAAIISIPVALMSIASDLIESLIKRKAGVKDSGKLIPGIGGAFDLTDSLLLSAPVGFILLKYFVLFME